MIEKEYFSTRVEEVESSYQKRYYSYYKFRLRVLICSFLCLLAVAFVVASLIIQVFNSSTIFPKSYELAEEDMRVITVSTTFCEGIFLEPSKLPRSLSIVSGVSMDEKMRVSNTNLSVYVPYHKYWCKPFYLLKGSSIQISASSDSFFKLLIFKRRQNFDGWIDKQGRQRNKRLSKNDDNKRTRISYVYHISQEGNYYILFQHVSGVSRVARLSVVLTVARRVYDISSTVDSCNAPVGKTCYAQLLFRSEEKTILQVLGSNTYLNIYSIPTTWHCQPRVWFFLLVFGGGYFLCVTCGFVIYILLMNRRRGVFNLKARKQSTKSTRSSFVSTQCAIGGSLKSKHSRKGSTQTTRSSSLHSQKNRPISGNETLKRNSQETTLPSVIPHIYRGDSSDSDRAIDRDLPGQESLVSLQQTLNGANSLENISLASFDTTVSLPVTFKTFRNGHIDSETASCHSFDVDIVHHHGFRHRNRHHPGSHRELSREREISARNREDQERKNLVPRHQSDSQLYHARRNMTLPARISRDRRAGRDFYRDLELAAVGNTECEHFISRQSDTHLDSKTMSLPRPPRRNTTRDFYRDLDIARKPGRARPVTHQSDSQLDCCVRKNWALPAPASRDFYRDLELVQKRDSKHNDIESDRDSSHGRGNERSSVHGRGSERSSVHGRDSDWNEREFEQVLEREPTRRRHREIPDDNIDLDDSDQFSIGDHLDQIADQDAKRAVIIPRSLRLGNGCPPQMEPLLKATQVEEHENQLVIEARAVPDGEPAQTDTRKKKSKNSNKKDVKLRNHSNGRRKDQFWKPRLSIVSEV